MKTPKNQPEPEPKGAPAVLSIAAEWEARARAKVEELRAKLDALQEEELDPANDGTDFTKKRTILQAQSSDAIKEWKGFADMVHKFDKTVDLSQRDVKESIPKGEASAFFTLATIYLRTGWQSYKEIVPKIRECATNEEAYAIVEHSIGGHFKTAMDSAVIESHVPAWVRDAVEFALV